MKFSSLINRRGQLGMCFCAGTYLYKFLATLHSVLWKVTLIKTVRQISLFQILPADLLFFSFAKF